MDCRIVLAHYTHPASFRSLVLTVLLAMIVPPTGLSQSPDGSTLLRAGQTSLQPLHPATSSTLPVIVQSGISARLGQDQVAYHATRDADTLRANNPAQHLRATFDAEGVNIAGGEQAWGLRLLAYGRGDALQPVAGASPMAHANRIEYARGPLTEWYVNGPFGLEQGFDLSVPPERGETAAPLTFSLEQRGALQPRVDADGRGLALATAEGEPVLRYAGLVAYDADRRELRAWLELRSDVLLVRVDEANARYPIRIDPLILNTKLTASDKIAEDYFGASVSISGDTIVVGVPNSDPEAVAGAGAAYVFVKPGGGWSGGLVEAAKLIASDKAIGAEFGYSVAISGDTVVVGATRSSPGGVTNAGTAYVFVRPGGGWSGTVTETTKLTASDKVADDRFGTSVAISGDTVVVGAVSSDPGYMDAAGSAYVFVTPAGGWSGSRTETAKLTASDKAAGDYFGTFVSIDGDTVVIGACGADPGGIDLAGAAYVFVKPGGGWSGNLTQNAKLTASDKAMGDDLGRSVAINGDTIVVGADAAGLYLYLTPRAGAVYVFVRPVAGWSGNLTQNAKLTALDSAANSYLGSSVAISGDIVVAGAPQSDTGGLADAGAAYVFVKPGGGWSGNLTENAKLIATDKAVDDRFGASVALSAGTVVLGAPNSRQGGLYRAGAAYVSLVAAANLSTVSLNFGSQLFAKTSAPQSVTFTNSGNLDLKVGSITANGDFAQTNNCPAMLAPLASCTIDVTFRPKAVGARTGALTIAYSGAGSPATVSLSGTGEGWLVHLPIIFK